MERLNNTAIVSINEEWFMHYFEKIIKNHVHDEIKANKILQDLRCLLKEANEI